MILSRPLLAGGVLLAVLSLFGAGIQTVRLNHAKADQIDPATGQKWKDQYKADHKILIAAQRDLTVCRGNVDQLTQAVSQQNAAVDGLKVAGDASTAAANAAVANVRQQNAQMDQLLRQLKTAKPASGDLCGGADDLIRTFAR
ncbi:hypothetical protein BH10PSE4_BH10PSE4_04960 [soil metagenome]